MSAGRREAAEAVGVEGRLRAPTAEAARLEPQPKAGARDPPAADPAGHLRERPATADVDEHGGADR